MRKIENFSKGMGIGGWLTNYKRFNVLPDEWRWTITKGDMEHFETYITEADVINIKNMGLDHIRLGFDQIVLEESPYVYREKIFEIILNFSSWCQKHGLRLVLNLHKAIGNYCDIAANIGLLDSEELQNRFVAMWTEIAKCFKDHEDVMFELLNEVRDVDPELWNNLADRTICSIRAVNENRYIILGCTDGYQPGNLKYVRIFDDPNIIYTFHNYAPFEFTHQRGVLQAHTLYYNRAMPYPTDDIERYRDYYRFLGIDNPYPHLERMDIHFLEESLKGAFEFAEEHPDKIVWCGEFGTIRHCNITYRENWMRDMIKLLKEHDMPYCVWNYLSTPNDGNRFSLVDDDTRKILSDEMLKIIRGEV